LKIRAAQVPEHKEDVQRFTEIGAELQNGITGSLKRLLMRMIREDDEIVSRSPVMNVHRSDSRTSCGPSCS
jgi:hypothetical protein